MISPWTWEESVPRRNQSCREATACKAGQPELYALEASICQIRYRNSFGCLHIAESWHSSFLDILPKMCLSRDSNWGYSNGKNAKATAERACFGQMMILLEHLPRWTTRPSNCYRSNALLRYINPYSHPCLDHFRGNDYFDTTKYSDLDTLLRERFKKRAPSLYLSTLPQRAIMKKRRKKCGHQGTWTTSLKTSKTTAERACSSQMIILLEHLPRWTTRPSSCWKPKDCCTL